MKKMPWELSEEERKYGAGRSTAQVDYSRGMSFEAMERVPQDTDHPAWACGYRDRLDELKGCQDRLAALERSGS